MRKPRCRPGTSGAIIPSGSAKPSDGLKYAEPKCKTCGADAGTPLPCAFCPKPIKTVPIQKQLGDETPPEVVS